MTKSKIYYFTLTDEMRREEKLDWFASSKFQDIPFEHIQPDKKANWIDLTDNDWDELISLANKETKLSKSKNEEKAIFKLFSLGVVTARDEWVYDFEKEYLENKVKHLIDIYNTDVAKLKGKSKSEIKDEVDYSIKWTRAVKNDLAKGKEYKFSQNNIRNDSIYRPFVDEYIYFAKELNEMQYQLNHIFVNPNENTAISISGGSISKPFQSLAINKIFSYDLLEKTQCLPLYRYDTNGNRYENITDWGLRIFQEKYSSVNSEKRKVNNEGEGKKEKGEGKKRKTDNGQQITKEDIFYYTYAVLHNPAYRKKYELNLKREFPRIPFYDDFWKWSQWGKELMDLHINFEEAEKYPLQILDSGFDKARTPNAKLRADKENGIIILDEQTSLTGIPKEAWQYKLGNRSALEWILDQYKEKKPKDPTIREKFNTYKFADYKEKVIDLLMRVTTVSIKTMKIVNRMSETPKDRMTDS